MKRLKKFFFVVLALSVVVVVTSVSWSKFQEHRITQAVKNGAIVIDQEIHDWDVGDIDHPADDDALRMTIYMRNTSALFIEGHLVLSATLDVSWLEETHIREVIRVAEKAQIMDKLSESATPKAKALQAYLDRGKQLAPGQEFEPVDIDDGSQPYSFLFRERISVKPGEIVKIVRAERVPPRLEGHPLDLSVIGIEFD